MEEELSNATRLSNSQNKHANNNNISDKYKKEPRGQIPGGYKAIEGKSNESDWRHFTHIYN